MKKQLKNKNREIKMLKAQNELQKLEKAENIIVSKNKAQYYSIPRNKRTDNDWKRLLRKVSRFMLLVLLFFLNTKLFESQ